MLASEDSSDTRTTVAPRTAARGSTHPLVALGRTIPIGVIVFGLGLITRLGVIFRSGGLHGSYGYDPYVYFAASDALTHGRLPYRDFVLLHPPGLMLALTPFALLTRAMSDDSAFAVAALAFAVLGALNAVLVVRVARRLGLGPAPAGVAGCFYAIWFGAIGAEYSSRLEPLGNLLLLLALLAALRALDRGSARWALAGGLALGALVSVKIWWLIPVVAVLVWYPISAGRPRAVLPMLYGVGLAVLAIDAPFFLVAPHAMWSAVVQDQLGRSDNQVSPLLRLGDVSSLPALTGKLPPATQVVVSIGLLALAWLLVRRAWRVRTIRPVVCLVVLQAVVLFASPSWFAFYTDYLAVGAALTVGAAATLGASASGRRETRSPRIPNAGHVAIGIAALVTLFTLVFATDTVHPLRGASRLAYAVRDVRCVMSDSPMGLIELDALSRDLRDGCRNWIDVTGRTYGPPDRASVRRIDNPQWQRDLRAYLRSGGAVIIVRARGTGINRASRKAITRDGVLARAGGQIVYRVQP